MMRQAPRTIPRLARVAVFLLVGSLAGATAARAQEVLTVAGYGGSYQAGMKEKLIPLFERTCNCRIAYVPGLTSATVARLIAEKASPSLDVAIIDEGPQTVVAAQGLLKPLDAKLVPNLAELYPIARIPGDTGVKIGVTALGLTYNAAYFKDHNLAPLTSWADLGRADLKGKVAFPSITTALGIGWLVMEAKMNGGSETDIGPGFAAIAKVAGNALTFDKTADLSPLYQQGAIVAGSMSNFRTAILARQNFPVVFVYPKEGAPAIAVTANVVAGTKHADLAARFINFLLSPEAQAIAAETVYFGPLNTRTELPPAVQSAVIYGPAAIAKLVVLNFPVINANIAGWTERWNKDIEAR